MPSTVPDGLSTPGLGNPYKYVADMALLAQDVQDALIRRANSYIGPGSDRTSFVDPPEGTYWRDSDFGKRAYIYILGNWRLVGEMFSAGTSGDRVAMVNPEVGFMWRDTNGDRKLWWWDGSEWAEVLPTLANGATTTITRSGSAPTGGANGDIHLQMI